MKELTIDEVTETLEHVETVLFKKTRSTNLVNGYDSDRFMLTLSMMVGPARGGYLEPCYSVMFYVINNKRQFKDCLEGNSYIGEDALVEAVKDYNHMLSEHF